MTDTNWTSDTDKKRASYAGHTDIGSVTFLYCNPVVCLQVYAPEGWRYVPYILGSFIVNIGDRLESLTGASSLRPYIDVSQSHDTLFKAKLFD